MRDNFSFVEKILENRPATHILFWVVIFWFPVVQRNILGDDFSPVFYSYIVILPSQLMGAYFLTYYLIPQYLYKKKYWQFVLISIGAIYLLAVLARIMTVYVAEPLFIENPTQETILEIFANVPYLSLVYVPSVTFIPIFMASLKVIKDTYRQRQRIETLKREKTKAELNYLKAQIHPHFLLNTLNNLYALTLKKSDKAPETVIKLSEMLVYILYKCDEKFVSLDSEIKLLENYISLEKLRYGDNLKLSFNKKIADESAKIAPLILLSIVENAFKHGVSGETDNAEIRIDLELIGDSFTFEVFNTKTEIEQRDETDYKKGIGFSNVKKQLDLVYGNKYSLDVTEKERSYKVLLKLDLNTDGI